jgi:exonuclease VII small subunit
MNCEHSRHFAANCLRKLKAASGQVEIIMFKEDLEKDKNMDEEWGKV